MKPTTKSTPTKSSTPKQAAPAAHTATPTAASAPAAAPMLAPTPPSPASPPVTGVANGNNKGTKVELQTSYAALIAGLEQNYQPGDVFELPAGNMTRDQLVAVFQNFVNTAQATKSSYAAWRSDVQAERAAEVAAAPTRAALKVVLVGKLGKTSVALLGYGFTPAKVPVRSTTSKSTAVAKSKATRVARGTMGKKQKQAIKGNVTGVIITPVTAQPAPAPAPAASNGAPSAGVQPAVPAATHS